MYAFPGTPEQRAHFLLQRQITLKYSVCLEKEIDFSAFIPCMEVSYAPLQYKTWNQFFSLHFISHCEG